jgi:hypothetical protein
MSKYTELIQLLFFIAAIAFINYLTAYSDYQKTILGLGVLVVIEISRIRIAIESKRDDEIELMKEHVLAMGRLVEEMSEEYNG